MFQFRRFPTIRYLIHVWFPRYCRGGFPHSEISGSTLICSSPKLIAAYHVLHRLLMPRHSPCALYSLTFSRSISGSSVSNYADSLKKFSTSLIVITLIVFFLYCCLLIIASLLFQCSVFKVHYPEGYGGPKWTRTTDLTIISRVL